MKKHYIALVLLAVFLPALIVPAHAASDSLTVNLLNSVQFHSPTVNQVSPVPSFQIFNYDLCAINWETAIPYNCSSFVLGLYSSSPIDSITFNGMLGDLIGSNGNYYQFKFTPGEDILIGQVTCRLVIYFSSDYQHNINLVSFYGYQSNFLNVTDAHLELMRQYQVRDHEMLQFSTIVDQVIPFPFSKEYYQLSWSGTPERLYYGISYLNIDPSDLGVDYLDSLQIQFSFTGTDYHSARLIDKDTSDTVTVLDYNYYHSTGYPFETMNGLSDYEVNLYHTVMDIDLKGHNLSNCYIQVVFGQDALVWGAVTENQEGFYISYDWARAILPDEDLPWYTVFGRWLKSIWSECFDWLAEIADLIEAGFLNLTDNLRNWFTDLTDSISEWGQNIVDALTPDTSGSDQAATEMSGIADEFDDANSIISTAPRPDVNDISGDISNIIDPGSLSGNSSFLTVLVSSPTIGTVLTLSLILTTAAYVLFGKR